MAKWLVKIICFARQTGENLRDDKLAHASPRPPRK
jgi:hypothetical protein